MSGEWNAFEDVQSSQTNASSSAKCGFYTGLHPGKNGRLVVLNEEGVYRLYDPQGECQQHSLGSEAAEMGIIDARIHENGLVALTGSLTLLEIKDWQGGKPLTLANPGVWVTYAFLARED